MFNTTINVRLYDDMSQTRYTGDVSVDLGAHGSLRDLTRDGCGAKKLLERMFNNGDTYCLLGDTTDASVKTLNFERVETYRIGKTGMFFEIEEQEGIVIAGCLQLRKYKNNVQVSGDLKVITYLGKKEVCNKSTYHPDTYGLWQRGDEMVVAHNNYGHLVAIA